MSETVRGTPGSGLIYRMRPGLPAAASPVLLLHGLGGDEDVMWVFESALPLRSIAVAPRALLPAAEGGYSWARKPADGFPSAADFEPAVEAIIDLLAGLRTEIGVGESEWVWMGFSQGAGLAFAGAARAAARVAGVVALAGFLPEGFDSSSLARLASLPVYWGHGTQDDQVPVEGARRDVARLRQAGVDVSYCEADVGHKLGAECLRGLSSWLARGPAAQRL